jgi:hypothetical protein
MDLAIYVWQFGETNGLVAYNVQCLLLDIFQLNILSPKGCVFCSFQVILSVFLFFKEKNMNENTKKDIRKSIYFSYLKYSFYLILQFLKSSFEFTSKNTVLVILFVEYVFSRILYFFFNEREQIQISEMTRVKKLEYAFRRE